MQKWKSRPSHCHSLLCALPTYMNKRCQWTKFWISFQQIASPCLWVFSLGIDPIFPTLLMSQHSSWCLNTKNAETSHRQSQNSVLNGVMTGLETRRAENYQDFLSVHPSFRIVFIIYQHRDRIIPFHFESIMGNVCFVFSQVRYRCRFFNYSLCLSQKMAE